MSYDLYFKPRHGSLTEESFNLYFSNKPNYTCEGSQAWYNNEDTGVYFVFEFQEEDEPEENNETLEYFPIVLNINYIRPSYFILEAEPEVTALVKYFDLLISDPQMEGMGDGEYNVEKLLSGWNHGNEFGYSAVFKEERNRGEVFHLTTEQLHNAWKWNLYRSQIQARAGEAKFVPKVMFLNLGGSTVTTAVWPDGIPIIIRPVDYLCVPRKEFAPRKFFRKKEDTTFMAWDTFLPILIKHGTQNEDGSFSLNYMAPPSDVAKFIRALPTENRVVAGLAADKVLDSEIYKRSIA